MIRKHNFRVNLHNGEQLVISFRMKKAHTLDPAILLLGNHPINTFAYMKNDLYRRIFFIGLFVLAKYLIGN